VGGGHRIGEFARRVGVTPELLRAWEQRYGLLRPVRTPGGFRLYGEEDAERVARMRRALDEGLSAAEAAHMALEASPSSDRPIEDAGARLMSAIESYDEAAVQAALDDGLAAFGLEAFVRDLILPTLAAVGRGWEQGRVGISQEHFASNLIRGRLLSLARLWGRGSGPLALLACAPGEQHDVSLLAFGLILRSYGWRILFLGADTPLSTLQETARTTGPAVIVLVNVRRCAGEDGGDRAATAGTDCNAVPQRSRRQPRPHRPAPRPATRRRPDRGGPRGGGDDQRVICHRDAERSPRLRSRSRAAPPAPRQTLPGGPNRGTPALSSGTGLARGIRWVDAIGLARMLIVAFSTVSAIRRVADRSDRDEHPRRDGLVHGVRARLGDGVAAATVSSRLLPAWPEPLGPGLEACSGSGRSIRVAV